MAGVFPASALCAGAVFCSAATRWVLAARQGSMLVFCPILAQAESHHRADLPIPWAEALQAGCPDGARIRCRPVLRPSLRGLTACGQFSTSLTERLLHTLRTELWHRQQEDASRPPTSPSRSPQNWLGQKSGLPPPVSCTGALSLPLGQAEPRSPRALHFF